MSSAASHPGGVVGLLDDAGDALGQLVDIDLDSATEADVALALAHAVHLQQRLGAFVDRAAAAWDRNQTWALDGSRSAAHAFSRDTGLSVATCRRALARGDSLRHHCVVAEAYATGDLTVDQTEVLVAAATPERAGLFSRDERFLVDQAALLSERDLRRVVKYWTSCADDELEVAPPTVHDGRHASITAGLDGEIELLAVLDPVGGAIVAATLGNIVDEFRRADRDDPAEPSRSLPQLRADALVELATRAAHHERGDGTKGRVLVTVAVGGDTFGRLCELGNGQVVTAADLAPYRHRIDVNAILFDEANHAIVGTERRSFTGLLRRAVEVRDLGCIHPAGCDEPLDRCDVDHIAPHRDHGPTSQANGRLLCRYHNRIWNNRTATADEQQRQEHLRCVIAVQRAIARHRRRHPTHRIRQLLARPGDAPPALFTPIELHRWPPD